MKIVFADDSSLWIDRIKRILIDFNPKMPFILLMCILSGLFVPSNAQVKITDGALLTMDPNSLLELESTNKGLLIPRIAINSLILPAPLTAPVPAGMMVYSLGGTVANGFYYWSGTAWIPIATGIGSQWINNGTNIYYNTGNVGIGNSAVPLTALDVNGQITLRTGASARALLVSDANGTGTWTSPGSIYSTPVTKSVSSTLLKTETIVLATGNITITLPVVTVADDGLEITVKNVGTYTDLITVVPQAGKTLDAVTSSLLTRWVGRTYIATGSNWIVKNKETRPDHQYEVSQLGSFITIAEVVAFLTAHISGPSVVKIGGGTYQIAATQTINLPFPVTFEGISYGESTITGAAGVSGTPLFSCQTESYFKMLKFAAFSNASGNDAIRFTGSGTYHEVKDCDFAGFNKGIVFTNNSSSWIFENTFEDCTGAAVEIAAGAASGGIMEMANCDFTQCAVGINLLSGVAETISIMTSNFYNTTAGTDIGILYTPATFKTYAALFITNCAWNNKGTYFSGFDFSRPDGRDANAVLVNNAGTEDKDPHCKINVVNNLTTTTVVTAGTFYKANWTNTSVHTVKWTIVNNRITYQTDYALDAVAIITGDISVSGNNRILSIEVVKNGQTATPYGRSALRTTNVSGVPFQFSTVIYIQDMVKGDYLEFYVTSDNSGDNVILNDVQWYTSTK